ncbi:hypothetical protein JCM10213_004049 [Rhodosporidiobolus nylandii]
MAEAHLAAALLPVDDADEYSELQQYLDWPSTSVTAEFDRRKSLFKLVEGLEKTRFKALAQRIKATVPDELDVRSRLELVQKEALKTSPIPPMRSSANRLLDELKWIEDKKGHDSRDFLVALHDFHNEEILLYQACLREEAVWDYLEVLEDRLYEGREGEGGRGRLPRPRFL